MPAVSDTAQVFARRTVARHRERAASAGDGGDFLHEEIAARLVERLGEVRREFTRVLDLGCHGGALTAALRAGREPATVVAADLAAALARRAADRTAALPLVFDFEALPFVPGRFDLVVSGLALHWVNDVPGALIQIQRALEPDGLLLAAMFGAGTLAELRECLVAAESEVEGGVSPRVSPFVDVRDAGALLQRANYAMPVVDRDRITVSYDNAFDLMRDLRRMGETNALVERRRSFTRRETMLRAAALYQERFADADGRIPATFEVVYLTGWAPDPSQPKALRPGSAGARLAEALGVDEREAGEKAQPATGPGRRR